MGMDLELVSVKRWFSRLQSMQRCAANINNDTPGALTDFYRAKHADILPKPEQRNNFAFCMFRNTAISVTDQDFTCASSFHELLDEVHRSLRIAVRGLIRAIAIDAGSVPQNEDPQAFENRNSKDVFDTDTKLQSLCDTLTSAMPIFPQDAAGQQPFKALVKEGTTTVKDVIDQTVSE